MDHTTNCTFCEIIAGRAPATIVDTNAFAVAFLDLRQFHPGHVLVVPRQHVSDIRSADEQTAAAVLAMGARISRAVDETFPSDGLSLWHSAGSGAHQEVPHMHLHVHPRINGDELLHVYPRSPALPPRDTLSDWGARLRTALARETTDALRFAHGVDSATDAAVTVAVNGRSWRRLDSVQALAAARSNARVFVVDAASGAVHFGDGVHGARPPSGARVRVTYRRGAGAARTETTWSGHWPPHRHERMFAALPSGCGVAAP